MVGTAEYSDYPPAAAKLPRVGGHALDLEAVVALKPDLVMGWESGNAAASVARLRSLGLTVHLSEPNRIEDIAGELERIGKLGPAPWPRPTQRRRRFASAMRNWPPAIASGRR